VSFLRPRLIVALIAISVGIALKRSEHHKGGNARETSYEKSTWPGVSIRFST